MNDYKKVGNRYYKIEKSEGGVDMMVKATYDPEKNVYKECGRWEKAEFDKHETVYDGNTETEFTKIGKEIKPTLLVGK